MAGSAIIADVYTDVWYKVGGGVSVEAGVWAVALVETIILYTIGSEVLFMFASQNLVEYLPDAIVGVFVIASKFGEGLGSTVKWIVGGAAQQAAQARQSEYAEMRDGLAQMEQQRRR